MGVCDPAVCSVVIETPRRELRQWPERLDNDPIRRERFMNSFARFDYYIGEMRERDVQEALETWNRCS